MPESPETKGQGHIQTPITSPSPMAGGTAPGLRDVGRSTSNTGKSHDTKS